MPVYNACVIPRVPSTGLLGLAGACWGYVLRADYRPPEGFSARQAGGSMSRLKHVRPHPYQPAQ